MLVCADTSVYIRTYIQIKVDVSTHTDAHVCIHVMYTHRRGCTYNPLCLRFLSCKWKGLPWVSKSNKWQVDLEVPLPQPGQAAIIDYRLFPLSQVKVKVKVAQWCPTLCHPMDYTVHGILQARTLEWVAIPFSRGSFQPRDPVWVSRTAGRFFTVWATREVLTPRPALTRPVFRDLSWCLDLVPWVQTQSGCLWIPNLYLQAPPLPQIPGSSIQQPHQHFHLDIW